MPPTTSGPPTPPAVAAAAAPGRSRRGPGALALLAAVAVTAGACSSGSPAAPAAVVARGTVSCRSVTGSVSFSPPLTAKGTSPETSTIAVSASRCTVSGSNVNRVEGASASATLMSATNACQGLLTSQALTFTVHWSPSIIRPTVLHYSGYTVSVSAGKGAFTLPDAGGTASVTGSFAGSDHGAGSSALAVADESATGLVSACGSSTGLASIPVTSGTLTLK